MGLPFTTLPSTPISSPVPSPKSSSQSVLLTASGEALPMPSPQSLKRLQQGLVQIIPGNTTTKDDSKMLPPFLQGCVVLMSLLQRAMPVSQRQPREQPQCTMVATETKTPEKVNPCSPNVSESKGEGEDEREMKIRTCADDDADAAAALNRIESEQRRRLQWLVWEWAGKTPTQTRPPLQVCDVVATTADNGHVVLSTVITAPESSACDTRCKVVVHVTGEVLERSVRELTLPPPGQRQPFAAHQRVKLQQHVVISVTGDVKDKKQEKGGAGQDKAKENGKTDGRQTVSADNGAGRFVIPLGAVGTVRQCRVCNEPEGKTQSDKAAPGIAVNHFRAKHHEYMIEWDRSEIETLTCALPPDQQWIHEDLVDPHLDCTCMPGAPVAYCNLSTTALELALAVTRADSTVTSRDHKGNTDSGNETRKALRAGFEVRTLFFVTGNGREEGLPSGLKYYTGHINKVYFPASDDSNAEIRYDVRYDDGELKRGLTLQQLCASNKAQETLVLNNRTDVTDAAVAALKSTIEQTDKPNGAKVVWLQKSGRELSAFMRCANVLLVDVPNLSHDRTLPTSPDLVWAAAMRQDAADLYTSTPSGSNSDNVRDSASDKTCEEDALKAPTIELLDTDEYNQNQIGGTAVIPSQDDRLARGARAVDAALPADGITGTELQQALEPERVEQSFWRDNAEFLWEEYDVDGDGRLDRAELFWVLHDYLVVRASAGFRKFSDPAAAAKVAAAQHWGEVDGSAKRTSNSDGASATSVVVAAAATSTEEAVDDVSTGRRLVGAVLSAMLESYRAYPLAQHVNEVWTECLDASGNGQNGDHGKRQYGRNACPSTDNALTSTSNGTIEIFAFGDNAGENAGEVAGGRNDSRNRPLCGNDASSTLLSVGKAQLPAIGRSFTAKISAYMQKVLLHDRVQTRMLTRPPAPTIIPERRVSTALPPMVPEPTRPSSLSAALEMLASMGFVGAKAELALQLCNNNPQHAVSMLLENPAEVPAPAPAPAPEPESSPATASGSGALLLSTDGSARPVNSSGLPAILQPPWTLAAHGGLELSGQLSWLMKMSPATECICRENKDSESGGSLQGNQQARVASIVQARRQWTRCKARGNSRCTLLAFTPPTMPLLNEVVRWSGFLSGISKN